MPDERDKVEPPQIAVQTFGGDTAEALDLAMAAGGRLEVQGAAHPFAGGAVDALAEDAEHRGGGPMAAAGVGDKQASGQ